MHRRANDSAARPVRHHDENHRCNQRCDADANRQPTVKRMFLERSHCRAVSFWGLQTSKNQMELSLTARARNPRKMPCVPAGVALESAMPFVPPKDATGKLRRTVILYVPAGRGSSIIRCSFQKSCAIRLA